jgi:single-stranded-DNA-specific exonuclease
MKYKAKCGELTQKQLAEFEGSGYSEKFIRLLIARGIDTKEKAQKFFDFSPDRLHDPFLLKGMQEAVARIKSAIAQKERILIVGDYDADGICSVAILYKYFLSKRVKTSYFLPERDADGYGLNTELIKTLDGKYRPDLLITVDCGISCFDEIEFAKSIGWDCIVTDHHAIPEKTPDCICIDPKFENQKYPFNDLCGAGVALKVVQALSGLDEAKKYFDICSIATVADIVSLTDENRIIVRQGLAMLNKGTVPGITALSRACNIKDEIKSSDISYRLGPKINASGRMGNAKKGLDIILEHDPHNIERVIKNLLSLNTRRQELCTEIYNAVIKIIEEENLAAKPVIVVARPEFESGVLGIVSARITEKYGKPSITLGGTGDIYKGSGRSIAGINLVQTISGAADLLVSFGGHSMAAGLSVPVAKYDEFVTRIMTAVGENSAGEEISADKYYDFTLSVDDLTPEFMKEVATLEPTGCQNPAPVFMTVIRKTAANPLTNHNEHTRFEAGNVKFIFFGGSSFNEILHTNCEKSIIFELQQSDGEAVRAVVKCVIPFALNEDDQALVLERYLCGELATEPDGHLTDIIDGLSVDRDEFVRYYKAVVALANVDGAFASVLRLYNKLAMDNKNIFQFVFCFAVFKQLGIIEAERRKIIIHKTKSTELNKSSIYKTIQAKHAAACKAE